MTGPSKYCGYRKSSKYIEIADIAGRLAIGLRAEQRSTDRSPPSVIPSKDVQYAVTTFQGAWTYMDMVAKASPNKRSLGLPALSSYRLVADAHALAVERKQLPYEDVYPLCIKLPFFLLRLEDDRRAVSKEDIRILADFFVALRDIARERIPINTSDPPAEKLQHPMAA